LTKRRESGVGVRLFLFLVLVLCPFGGSRRTKEVKDKEDFKEDLSDDKIFFFCR
jgi:hypothetical protein